MQLMGLESIAPKKRMTISDKAHKIYPYLLRSLEITYSNQVWCSNLTYIRLKGGLVYLTVMIDWDSRCVLSWKISVTMMEEGFCVSALERACGAIVRLRCSIEMREKPVYRECAHWCPVRSMASGSAWTLARHQCGGARTGPWITSWLKGCGE
ncbi:MAG: hypothetical protein JRI72_03030 [Deltaproteobacteria bacterium]|nr:hypothetical protein [Deltaproteobacteria bacterium]